MQTQRATSHDAITDLNGGKITDRCTYFFLIHVHQPVAHIKEDVDPMVGILTKVRWMRVINPRDSLVLPYSAETSLVVKQAQFFNYVVHDQVDVDLWLVTHTLLIRLAQLTNLADVEALIWVQLQHAHDYAP